ncbi:MAG TPA: CpsD/CapB family tyrosine-protein kinase [Candidatus Acidoferrum sp.]|nr:CpsD/CapB family tyrosine-protein kinase [Candidatus Acidoferrum sp.]
MSRIHEALKKAAQERSSRVAANEPPAPADVVPAFESASGMGIQVAELAARANPMAEGLTCLRFDDLVKRCAHPTWQLDPRMKVHSKTEAERVGAERFRTLRSRLYQIAATRPMKKVLVTSSVKAEGKTFIAGNLAHSIVRQPDRRVLLIDADLRASRLHQLFGAPNGPGLADYLSGEADEYAVIQNPTGGNLFFIPGGTQVSNPSELLLGERMKSLLDLVTPIFDWVILDSPPTLPVHDASNMADLCDGVLFVVRSGKTPYQIAERASSEFLKKNLLGVVLNDVEKSSAYYGYYADYSGDNSEDQ